MTTAAPRDEGSTTAGNPAPVHVAAGYLSPWTVGQLPLPPTTGWRSWFRLLGPGILLAGASVGSGEWLFGPAVSAQYGGTLLWLATLSIVGQVFCNLEMMRYAVYCGESIVVGYLRTWPGPRFWIVWYALLDLAAIWPFNASNAAVPLAAAMLGHLPGESNVVMLGVTLSETFFVKVLGYIIFLVCFVPLIFGGTIYKMLERVMTGKLLITLGYLVFFTLFTVSLPNAWEVVSGFFRFGVVPLRAQTVVAGRHFTIASKTDEQELSIKGTLENGLPVILGFDVKQGDRVDHYEDLSKVPSEFLTSFDGLQARAAQLARPGHFFVEALESSRRLTVSGTIGPDQRWSAEEYVITNGGQNERFATLEAVPAEMTDQFRQLVANQGVERVTLTNYWQKHGALPPLDWAMLAAFAAIAGAGGMTNSLFSNFARDAGWGMGANVGAIPSALGGRQIKLSHVGEVFISDAAAESKQPDGAGASPAPESQSERWRGWMRHIVRDQLAIWMLASLLGMALPCMLSLQFIRHAPVTGNRVAAMTAEGMADRYPDHRQLLWSATLLCGFLVLAPGQILSGDQIARRWTDIIWTASSRAKQLPGSQVGLVYYGILALYGAWGLVALTLFNPLQIAKIAAVLMNVALGWSALHAVYVNRTLLPRSLHSPWFMQLGSILCGLFFLLISAIVFWNSIGADALRLILRGLPQS